MRALRAVTVVAVVGVGVLSLSVGASVTACSSTEALVDHPGVAADGGDVDGGADALAAVTPHEWKPCKLLPTDATEVAECTTLDVPLDYAQPGGPTIALPVKRYAPRGASAAAAQVWLVDGGPGGAASVELGYLAGSLPKARPDVAYYAIDHRGTGGPDALDCAAGDAGAPSTEAEWDACAAALRAKLGDRLQHYSTSNAARDLAAAVDAYRDPSTPVFVSGISYGTYHVLRYLEIVQHPPTGVILEGISVPGVGFDGYDVEMDAAAQKLFAVCAADATCRAKFDADPWSIASALVPSFDQGHCAALGLTSHSARELLGALVINAPTRSYLPAIVRRLARCEERDRAAITHLYDLLFAGPGLPGSISMETFFHVALSEMWPPEGFPDPATVDEAVAKTTVATEVTSRLAKRQASWPTYARDALVGKLPSYSGPLLMLQGELDPATPIEHAARLRDVFTGPGQTWVQFATGSHAVMDQTPALDGTDCGRAIVLQFLADPTKPIDTSCTTRLAPVDFTGDAATNRALFGVTDAWDG